MPGFELVTKMTKNEHQENAGKQMEEAIHLSCFPVSIRGGDFWF